MASANQYKAMMDQAEPPAHLQDDVMARLGELRGEKAAGREGATCGPQAFIARAGGKRRAVPRAAKVLTGALAAAVVAGALIAVPALLPGVPGGSEGAGAGTPASSLAEQFGLALYADADEGGQTVSVATADEGIVPFGGEGGPRPSALSYQLNLACVGEGIESVIYAIDGEDVALELIDMKPLEDGTLVPSTYTASQEFTLDYADQQPEDLCRLVKVDLRTPEERDWSARVADVLARLDAATDPAEKEALNNELTELDKEQADSINGGYEALGQDEDARYAAMDELFFEASCEAAQKIGQATLSATATFTDGTTLMRRYRIMPVENFEQVFADRMAANREQGRPDDDPRLTAPLFEITELA